MISSCLAMAMVTCVDAAPAATSLLPGYIILGECLHQHTEYDIMRQ